MLRFGECRDFYVRTCEAEGESQVSLKDPVTSERMNLPCRGIECTHLQAFDFSVYKRVNEKQQRHTSEYRCPVCNQLRNPSSLFLDPILLAILASQPQEESVTIVGKGRSGKIQYDISGVTQTIASLQNSGIECFRGRKVSGRDSLMKTSLDDLILFINYARQDLLSKVWSLAEKRCQQIIAQRPFCCKYLSELPPRFASSPWYWDR